MNGHIVYDHKGEGAYQTIESKVQSLLVGRATQLRGAAVPEEKFTMSDATPLDAVEHASAEGFFGSERNSNLANGTGGKDGPQTFDSLSEPKLNMSYLFVNWKISSEYAESMAEHNSLIYRYHGKLVHALVGAKSMRAKILLDGKPLTAANAGKDIRFEKNGSILYAGNPRLYEVVTDQAGYGDHSIEMIPESGGFDIYSLIFS